MHLLAGLPRPRPVVLAAGESIYALLNPVRPGRDPAHIEVDMQIKPFGGGGQKMLLRVIHVTFDGKRRAIRDVDVFLGDAEFLPQRIDRLVKRQHVISNVHMIVDVDPLRQYRSADNLGTDL